MVIRRHLRCITCEKRFTWSCKTLKYGQRDDHRGIFLYTRLNGCASHSDAHTINKKHTEKYEKGLQVTNCAEPVVVGVEKLSENVYKVWYQDVKNGKSVGSQYHVLLTRNEYTLTLLREKLVREYNVPADYVNTIVNAAQLVDEEERNGISWRYYTDAGVRA